MVGLIAICSMIGVVSPYADAINLVAPLWQVVGLIMIVGATALAAGRSRGWLAVPALCLFCAFAVTVLPDWLPRLPRPAGVEQNGLKVVIFNAWKNNATPERAARWIAQQSPDVVVLAEIDWQRGGIPARLKQFYPYQQDCSGAHRCSTAVLSRIKPIASGGLAHGDPENKSALSAAWIRLAGTCGAYDIVGVHLNHPWPMAGRAGERRQLADFLRGRSTRAILAGDLNLPPWMFELGWLERDTGLARRTLALPTWPSPSARGWLNTPLFPLDHLLAGKGWAVSAVMRGPDIGSDHYPMVIRLVPISQCAPSRL
ncbi:endonuclease/exonuclease/phosphatase family protein [Sphingomonas sp. PL20]|uniref:endonuclease/exonuclease/phosphatase family protein n=1 Tax=Sphingomonas sp. PL20 TaxID=2760712 RepID=UPI001AE6C109